MNWYIKDGKLCSNLIFNTPLEMNGNVMAHRLIDCLNYLSIHTTDDIDINNTDMKNVYE